MSRQQSIRDALAQKEEAEKETCRSCDTILLDDEVYCFACNIYWNDMAATDF